ncbi:MAG: DMT family transporter [Sporomusaceae bacterium]|nr:DMT family transporter [Sporomusaceae bacterium]
MIYYLFALLAGFAATLQAGINGKLQVFLGSPLLTSFVSFLVGSVGLGAAYLATVFYQAQPIPSFASLTQTSIWMWSGGLLGAFFVFTTIFCLPKIGFANLFSLIVAGQLLLAIFFDHYGLLGNTLHLLNPYRLLGVALLVTGVYLIQTH